jgi:hypothetical protein
LLCRLLAEEAGKGSNSTLVLGTVVE